MRTQLTGLLVWAAMAFAGQSAHAQIFSTLYSFNGTDGFPNGSGASLVQGADGELYGTTNYGGINGGGTVFRMTTGGRVKTMYNFCAQSNCADGGEPIGGLLLASDGNFYGTTSSAGPYDSEAALGTVFKITPDGVLSTVYSFCAASGCPDGRNPRTTLVQATDGNLYGSTPYGGANGGGTLFRLTLDGVLTTLYNFCSVESCLDGNSPGGLVQGTDGNFYGATQLGGAANAGTVFKMTPAGELTKIYEFCTGSNYDGVCLDGMQPYWDGSLTVGADGLLYGTTVLGGVLAENGVVFELTSSGDFSVLASAGCGGGCPPGGAAIGGAGPDTLIIASDGNLYGTTYEGGTVNYAGGEIFEISAAGVANLYSIPCAPDVDCDAANAYPSGAFPSYGGMLQATDGNFYGLLQNGGANYNAICPAGCGALYRYSTGLGPMVRTQSSMGLEDSAVSIFGTDLTNATSVTFNGTPATFRVKSATEITTRVPSGATTGLVQVITPTATLNSNVPYTVFKKTALPVFRPEAGTYARDESVRISDVTAGSTIYYTTDGSTPTQSSTQYSGPIKISATTTLKAIALGPEDVISSVKSGTYTIE